MQLILESETALDIAPNMSIVEDLQNNKMQSLGNGSPNKCNINKDIIEVDTYEMETTDKSINNKVEISETDESCTLSNKNNIIGKIIQEEVPQNDDLIVMQVDETNDVPITEKENDRKSEEIPDDYLEDDIISIREESFNVESALPNNTENMIIETDKEVLNKTLSKENKTLDIVNEVIDESPNHTIDNPIISEEKDEFLKNNKGSNFNCDSITEAPTAKEPDVIDITLDTNPTIICEMDVEDTKIKTADDVKIDIAEEAKIKITESNIVCVLDGTEDAEVKDNTTVVGETQSSVMDENQIETPLKTSLQEVSNIDLTENKNDISIHTMDVSINGLSNINKDKEVKTQSGEESASTRETNVIDDDDESNVIEDVMIPKTVSDQCHKVALPNKVDTNDCVEVSQADVQMNLEDTVKISTYRNEVDPVVVIKDLDDKESITKVSNNTETDTSSITLQPNCDVEMVESTMKVKEKQIEVSNNSINKNPIKNSNPPYKYNKDDKPIICKLSNTLDILSDEEEELPANVPKATEIVKEKQCINLDDDDIMLIDEDTSKIVENTQSNVSKAVLPTKESGTGIVDSETGEKSSLESKVVLDNSQIKVNQKEVLTPNIETKDTKMEIDINEKTNGDSKEKLKKVNPLIPENFVTAAKTKFADMTRENLEEFCILKIVESIVDRSSLSDIKNKLKEMTQSLEDFRKKALMLTKQNRDLQVVLRSVQEEQRKATAGTPITPLKITRSVGVQVIMDKMTPRKKVMQPNVNNKNGNTTQIKPAITPVRSPAVPKPNTQNIPVPRLVPAFNAALKTPASTAPTNQPSTPTKNNNQLNGAIRNPSPTQKADKRPHSKVASSETVDLTDDEPPPKIPGGPKSSATPPVRVVPPQNLMPPQRQPFATPGVNGKKVYIPINGPPSQAIRPGQTIMLKPVPAGTRPKWTPQRMESPAMRLNRNLVRHPAPLPLTTKQYQPPNWKSLPPAPDLKLSKVENGIVISWKIEDIPEDSYEEIASYQLYAYQETTLPASTSLWKKIGDVKALPLPMACTLTQFMAGYKYYFAVRAVDIRSRLGPFSLPGSILLLNKNVLD